MTKPSETLNTQKRAPRKSTIWTREKIAQLIDLYRKADCLWNHYIEDYKSKECRNKAIEDICTTLCITKFDFGKKIHNLRNQFNSEMKKLERRIEVSGGNLGDVVTDNSASVALAASGKRCRWEHFETLMFLRTVIEPRPGYQCGATTSSPPSKKLRTKVDFHEDVSNIENAAAAADNSTTAAYVEDGTNTVTESNFTNCIDDTRHPDMQCDQKYLNTGGGSIEIPLNTNYTTAPATPTAATTATTAGTQHTFNSITTVQQQKPELDASSSGIAYSDGPTVQTNQPITSAESSTAAGINSMTCTVGATARARDQWDAFGEMIASEFRNLNSDYSRKKLKRKIMQAMLEIGIEDDRLSVGVN